MLGAIEQHPAMALVERESQTIGSFGRNDRFEYLRRFAGTGDIRNRDRDYAQHADQKTPVRANPQWWMNRCTHPT